jgi:hypothetical protein
VRIPRELSARAVRRVVCDGCHQTFACESAIEIASADSPRRRLQLPRTAGMRRLSDPESHAWRYLSVPIAAAAVIVALVLIQGSGEPARHSASSAAPAAPGPSAKGSAAEAADGSASSANAQGAEVVKGSSFTLALPAGWERSEPRNGATFAAASSDGDATATLWIHRDPNLSYPDFEARSLAQLQSLAGSAHVVNRVTAPTPEGTVVTLAADSPPDQPTYEVTLRMAGPYRYYLATTVDPNASRAAVDGADLIHSSFIPTVASSGQ